MSPCVEGPEGVIVCGVPRCYVRMVQNCPFCGVKRRFTGLFTSVWYGTAWVCTWCGTEFHDGYNHRYRSGVQNNKRAKEARANWKKAMPKPEYKRMIHAELKEYAS